MAEVPNSRILKAFNKWMDDQPRLRGLDDFVHRLPELVARRITDCGAQHHGFRYDEKISNLERAGIQEGEVNTRVQYQGYSLFWGEKAGEIRTRMAAPLGESSSALSDSSKAIEYLLNRFFAEYEIQGFKKRTFNPGKVFTSNLGAVVSLSRYNPDDPMRGELEPYWMAYWNNVMKPILGIARHLKQHDGIDYPKLFEEFPVLKAPDKQV